MLRNGNGWPCQRMSNAICQNATDLAVSSPKVIDLAEIVAKAASRKAGGLTMQATMLDQGKLFSAVAAEFKSLSGMERTARLASEVVDKINGAIDAFRNDLLAGFATDCKSHRVFAAHKANAKCFVRAEVIRRESVMSLGEQHLFAKIAVRKAEERWQKAVDENRHETAEKAKKALDKLTETLAHIESSMAQIQQG